MWRVVYATTAAACVLVSACSLVGPERRGFVAPTTPEAILNAPRVGFERLGRLWGDRAPCSDLVGIVLDQSTYRAEGGLKLRIGDDSSAISIKTNADGGFRVATPMYGRLWLELHKEARLIIGYESPPHQRGGPQRMVIVTGDAPGRRNARQLRVVYVNEGGVGCVGEP